MCATKGEIGFKLIFVFNSFYQSSPSVGNLSDLVFLQVSGNELEGPLPNELGQLTKLCKYTMSARILFAASPLYSYFMCSRYVLFYYVSILKYLVRLK